MENLRHLGCLERRILRTARWLLAGMFLLVLTAWGPSQLWATDSTDQPSRQSRGSQWELQRLNEVVNLTEEQKASVQRILEDQSDKLKALRSDQSLSREES